MRRDGWNKSSKSANQYYESGYGTDVTETGESFAGDPEGVTTATAGNSPQSRPYWVKDIWQAAYLDIQHIPFLSCEFSRDGRPRWYFANDDDRAFQAGRDFVNGEVTVPLQEYRQSYRFMQNQLNALRERGVSYGADRAA